MKLIDKIILTVGFAALFLVPSKTQAQQDAQYTNYMYNTTVINPAYAGTREVMSIFGLHRTQWVGLDGAPTTNNFSMHTPIRNSNVGIGISFINDRIGPSDENMLSADFAYRIQMSRETTLSFGIKAKANLLNVDYSKLDIYDNSDTQFQSNVDNRLSPNIGAGAYLYSNKYYVGLSVPDFLETKHYDNNSESLAKERLHFYLMGGYVFDLNKNVQFKPAFLTKMVSGSPLQVDLTANFMFNESLVLGAAYRWDAAASFLAGFQLSNKFFIGYGYDLGTNKLANFNSGSHEIFLRFELFNSLEKIYSPRFF